ncbi:hypothetical protein CPB86DRAFT_783447 [Serendipita vermifera]|nr:hypothetical protein CPB86DRAFT_783447 [Serendipita vermifera]
MALSIILYRHGCLVGFGFIEFESEKDAEDVVRNFNGKSFMGSELLVEFARETRSRRHEDRGGRYGSFL